MDWGSFTLRLFLALSLGALIGAERQIRQRLAGLRTNALVATGSALFVMVSAFEQDPQGATRIAAYVVSGIGFLGAGVIMREGGTVHGLNTAATLWCSAAIGVFCGLGHAVEGAIGAMVIVSANVFLRRAAFLINKQDQDYASEIEYTYRITLQCPADNEVSIRTLMLKLFQGQSDFLVKSLQSENLTAGGVEVRADLIATADTQPTLEHIVSSISQEPGVTAAAWVILETVDGEVR